MISRIDAAGAWAYRGVWGVLTRWFRVPSEPPALPVRHGETLESFRPAPAFRRYLLLGFWVGFGFYALAAVVLSLVTIVTSPVVGLIVLVIAAAGGVALGALGFLAVHLRYDTTWYIMTPRSVRMRRGIWVIRETTITFENVQNVIVTQGPIQRLFGIANVLVQTAGGGGGAKAEAHGGQSLSQHQGLIEGLADAHRIRDLILARLERSRSAGLGDEAAGSELGSGWGDRHVAVLREIRDASRRLVKLSA